MAEVLSENEIQIDVLAPNGLGYGEGSISVEAQIDRSELSRSSLEGAIAILKTDPEMFVPVDTEAKDDGCGDGRWTARIYRMINKATGKMETYTKSLRRAKLFGGGLIASSSMWRAVTGAPHNGETAMGDRKFLATKLAEAGIHYGAHTDSRADDEKCGCGAIDKYEDISRNVTKYKSEIKQSLAVLYGDELGDNQDAIEDVLDMYDTLPSNYFEGATGRATMDFIEQDGALIKELGGNHLEDLVVLNDVEGTTLDQQKLRDKLESNGLSPDIQAFVVDVWRGRMYADFVSSLAVEQGFDKDESYKRAYADFLIRTLAVSATLTAGDQPVIYRALAKSEVALTA